MLGPWRRTPQGLAPEVAVGVATAPARADRRRSTAGAWRESCSWLGWVVWLAVAWVGEVRLVPVATLADDLEAGRVVAFREVLLEPPRLRPGVARHPGDRLLDRRRRRAPRRRLRRRGDRCGGHRHVLGGRPGGDPARARPRRRPAVRRGRRTGPAAGRGRATRRVPRGESSGRHRRRGAAVGGPLAGDVRVDRAGPPTGPRHPVVLVLAPAGPVRARGARVCRRRARAARSAPGADAGRGRHSGLVGLLAHRARRGAVGMGVSWLAGWHRCWSCAPDRSARAPADFAGCRRRPRIVPGTPRGGTPPNSPRAGMQQGQVGSSRYAGCPRPRARVARVVPTRPAWRGQ